MYVRRLRISISQDLVFDTDAVRGLLTRMTYLETLELELGSPGDDDGQRLPLLSLILPPNSHLPKPKRLELAGFTTYKDDLMASLSQYSSTLGFLGLDRFTFLLYTAGRLESSQKASWVRIWQDLRVHLRLQHVRFKGVLRRILYGRIYED
jgi:hypothetical protein